MRISPLHHTPSLLPPPTHTHTLLYHKEFSTELTKISKMFLNPYTWKVPFFSSSMFEFSSREIIPLLSFLKVSHKCIEEIACSYPVMPRNILQKELNAFRRSAILFNGRSRDVRQTGKRCFKHLLLPDCKANPWLLVRVR